MKNLFSENSGILATLSAGLLILAISYGIGIPDRIPKVFFLSMLILLLLPVFFWMHRNMKSVFERFAGSIGQIQLFTAFLAFLSSTGYYWLYHRQVKCIKPDCVYYPFVLQEDAAARIERSGGKLDALKKGAEYIVSDLEETTSAFSWWITGFAFWMILFIAAIFTFLTFYLIHAAFFSTGKIRDPSLKSVESELQTLIGNDDLEGAFKLLLENVQVSAVKNEIILLQSDFAHLKKLYHAGEIGPEDFNIAQARLRKALLELVK
ncbi:MAG: hypothetical protein H6562_13740 [Lewinellaceae bacterium]|nr:hypothetical protein [Lewinellaceae bacterium]